MITLAALTGPLPKAGVVVVAVLAAAALLLRDDRQRALAMLGALVVSPPLLVALIWHDSKLHFVHRHPALAVATAVAALVVVVALAVAIDRRPALLPVLAVLALPFRISVAGSNLLVPLYFVIGAGALRYAVRALRSGDGGHTEASWLERLLALLVVLYGLQALYSSGFETGLKNVVFFYVPFALLYCLLVRIEWTPRLLRICAWAIAGLALALAGVAFVEYAARTTWFSFRLGEIYFHRGQLNMAATHLEEALKLNPSYPLALAWLGKVRAGQGKYDEAIRYYVKAVSVNGEPETRRGRQLHPGDEVRVGEEALRVASAGAGSQGASR